MLPVFFITLASAALVAALAALFASLRASLGGPTDEASWASAGPDRGALADEKNALLRALKDLEYEHEVGKIDDEDYARLERAYRARAKEVLGELDRDLLPYLSQAEALAGGVVGDVPGDGKRPKKGKKGRAKPGEAAAPPSATVPSATVPSATVPSGDDADEREPTARAAETANATETADAENTKDTGDAQDARAASEPPVSPVCPSCATTNDADARFCKKCATPLAVPT